MLKFTGLILICATSSLALLLPALGMVKFPMVAQGPEASSPVSPSNPPGIPVAASGLPGTSLPGADTPDPTQANPSPSLLGPPWTKQKLSLSAWLMLGPAMLIGLGLWTFSPNRSGSGR